MSGDELECGRAARAPKSKPLSSDRVIPPNGRLFTWLTHSLPADYPYFPTLPRPFNVNVPVAPFALEAGPKCTFSSEKETLLVSPDST